MESIKKQTVKHIGHIKSIKLNITAPIPMDTELDINRLNIMCGQNGVGKSFILVTQWVTVYIANTIVVKHLMKNNEPDIPFADFTVAHAYDNKVTGTIETTFENGSLKLVIQESRVVDLAHSGLDKIEEPTNCQYLSSAMRTFEAINLYLKMRKMAGGDIEKMLENYKIYDVMYVEGLLTRMPVVLDHRFKQGINKFMETITEMNTIDVDLEKCDFFTIVNGERKYLSTYSKGEQAIVNMFLAQVF